MHQRSHVHYLRNALTKVSAPATQEAQPTGLRDVWAAQTRAEAEQRRQQLIESLRKPLSAVAEWREESLGDTMGFEVLKEPGA